MSNMTTYRGKLTQCLAQRRYSRSPLPFPFPLFSLTMHLERGKSQVFECVKFSQVLTEELMSNSYYPFKSTFSFSMMKPPRPGPCLEELSRCFIKALVPSDAPLFQGVGWTHGSPMLVWLIDTFVLTHWHLQSRQSHLLRFDWRWRPSQDAKSAHLREGSLKDTMGWLPGKNIVRVVWPGTQVTLFPELITDSHMPEIKNPLAIHLPRKPVA